MSFSFKDIVDFANDVVIVTTADPIDPPGPEIVYVNKAFTELTGYTEEEAIGNNPRMLQSNDTSIDTKRQIKDALRQHKPIRVTIKNYSKTMQEYWLDLSILPLRDADGNVTHFAAIERDYTSHIEHVGALTRLTMQDPMTRLYNRRALNDMLPREFARLRRKTHQYSILAIDIDNFKNINDTYGHAVGDTVIVKVSHVIQSEMREQDWVARVGGEEFVAVLINSSIDKASLIAERIRHVISDIPFEYECGFFNVTVSLGVSSALESDEDEWQVNKRADKALYDAKHMGRNRVCIK